MFAEKISIICKAFNKLRDRFVRARRELSKEDQSGTSAKKIKCKKEKVEALQYLEWLYSQTPRRKSKTNMSVIDVDEESEHNKENGKETDFTREEDADIGGSTDALFHSPIPQKMPPAESNNNKSNKKVSKRRDEEGVLVILRDIQNAAKIATEEKNDRFSVFGKYVAQKMKKLSSRMDNDALDEVEFRVTGLLEEACLRSMPRFLFRSPISSANVTSDSTGASTSMGTSLMGTNSSTQGIRLSYEECRSYQQL